MYLKANPGRFITIIIHWWYLHANNDNVLLYEIKQILSKNFEMKDIGVEFCTGVEVHSDKSCGILGLS